MLRRSCGAVVSELMSRRPSMLMCNVRGIGVADIVSTSTVFRICFSRSLWVTPNRCSSSMTTRPKIGELARRCSAADASRSGCRSPPRAARRIASFCSFPVLNRLMDSM